MTLYDYLTSQEIARTDPPFAAVIMAAYRRADTRNAAKLEAAWPEICEELRRRYNTPGGRLPRDLDLELG